MGKVMKVIREWFNACRRFLQPRVQDCRIKASRLLKIIVPILSRFFSAFFKLTILIAILSFIQKQEPLVENTIDHRTKIIYVSNNGLSPIKVSIYAVWFGINWAKDKDGFATINTTNPILTYRTFWPLILNDATIWPRFTKTIDLRRNPAFEFSNVSDPQPVDEVVYCLAIEERDLFSNKKSVDVILTGNTLYSPTIFGPIGKFGGGSGGGIETRRKYWAVESQIEKDCLMLHSHFR